MVPWCMKPFIIIVTLSSMHCLYLYIVDYASLIIYTSSIIHRTQIYIIFTSRISNVCNKANRSLVLRVVFCKNFGDAFINHVAV